jgi:ABC-type cobalamin/Fe3+-siderophores transport system ATPase subunit
VADVPVLRLEGVWQAFERGRTRVPVLEDVSLDVQAGEIAAVVGGRGQGKTTLIRVASGTLPVQRGSVALNDRKLKGLSDSQMQRMLAADIGSATRIGPEAHLSVRDYLDMAISAARKYSVSERTHHIEEMIERLKLTDCAGAKWGELSDWQRVLVELAQAAIRRPALLLVDNIVDGLGLEEKQTAMTLIEGFAKELRLAVLMAVSDHAAALRSTKVWRLSHAHLELMHEDPGVVAYLHKPSENDQAL